jgi:hypothetical protein
MWCLRRAKRASEGATREVDAALADDLNTPVALASMWEAVRDSSLEVAQKKALLADFDNVLSRGWRMCKKVSYLPRNNPFLRRALRLAPPRIGPNPTSFATNLLAMGVVVKRRQRRSDLDAKIT